jgi:hypothetical protein
MLLTGPRDLSLKTFPASSHMSAGALLTIGIIWNLSICIPKSQSLLGVYILP